MRSPAPPGALRPSPLGQAWYDDQVWYPLGRHVGSTTYPGLQLTAWGLHRLLTEGCGVAISLHDVCVFLPAGFGAVATALTALLSWECTGSADAAAATAFFMSIRARHGWLPPSLLVPSAAPPLASGT